MHADRATCARLEVEAITAAFEVGETEPVSVAAAMIALIGSRRSASWPLSALSRVRPSSVIAATISSVSAFACSLSTTVAEV